MPSFDVVSEVDFQEVRNAVDQAVRELGTRFDFRGVDAGFELSDERIQLHAEEEFQLGQLLDILRDKLVKRGVDTRALDPGDIEASGKQKRQSFGLKQGIDRDAAKKIVKLIKDSKLKVQSQIQQDQVRVSGKKRDDLQAVMQLVREADDLGPEFRFTNRRE
jgi:uncharacterized protein YajQ (UPF0234 family)